MSIGLPQVTYNPGSGLVTLAFVRGPQGFHPNWKPRLHDNLSTSGAARERVVENLDILISFGMGHVIVDQDMPAWDLFLAFILAGGQFNFFPNSNLPDYYHCVEEAGLSEMKYTAPKKYAMSLVFRIINDSQAPANPGTVLRRLYGVTTP